MEPTCIYLRMKYAITKGTEIKTVTGEKSVWLWLGEPRETIMSIRALTGFKAKSSPIASSPYGDDPRFAVLHGG